MTFDELATCLKSEHPTSAVPLDVIETARRYAADVQFEPFFEPVSVIQSSNKKARLISFGPDILCAWIRHVSYATHVRLNSFEPAILSELAANRLLPAMVLTRSHLEASAFACLAERSLMKSAESGESEPLQDLIPKMLLGTSLRRSAKHNATIQSLLTMGEQATITATQGIKAMDEFVAELSDVESEGACRHTYSFLCEFSHPNPRGVRGFSQVLEQSEEGWLIEYSRAEEFEKDHLHMALEILARSVRVGYFAAEILRLTSFDVGESGFTLVPPSESEQQQIWVEVLQGRNPSEDA